MSGTDKELTPSEARLIAQEALYDAYHREADWSTRFEDARGAIGSVLAGLVLAWLLFVLTGGIALGVWVLAGGSLTASGFIIAALVAGLFATGYESARRGRQLQRLTDAMHEIERRTA